jgi:hypothetical protein
MPFSFCVAMAEKAYLDKRASSVSSIHYEITLLHYFSYQDIGRLCDHLCDSRFQELIVSLAMKLQVDGRLMSAHRYVARLTVLTLCTWLKVIPAFSLWTSSSLARCDCVM